MTNYGGTVNGRTHEQIVAQRLWVERLQQENYRAKMR